MWRYANVILVYKKRFRNSGTKSSTSFADMRNMHINGKKVTCHLMIELSQNKWLTDAQHEFRSKRSTTTSLLEFDDMVTKTRDRGCAIDIFYFDLEKSFNTILHEQLVA